LRRSCTIRGGDADVAERGEFFLQGADARGCAGVVPWTESGTALRLRRIHQTIKELSRGGSQVFYCEGRGLPMNPAASVEIDILMKKYALLREEVMFHFKTAKSHTKYFQAFFAACLAIGSYLFFGIEEKRLSTILCDIGFTKPGLIALLAWVMNATSYYYAFDVLDCYFCMYLAAARLANIEQQINEKLGSAVLIWESKFQAEKIATSGPSRKTITLYQIGLVFLVSFLFPMYVYKSLWEPSTFLLRIMLILAALFCTAMFLLFAYTCYAVFSPKRNVKIRSVVRQLQT
jgi:hypothetical protein